MSGTDRAAIERIEPTYFAEFAAALWRRQGWTMMPTSLDDRLYAAARRTAVGPQSRLLFAVYRSSGGTVGAAGVRDRARVDIPADETMLVTNTGFSPSAVETAAAYGVDLVGADDLARLIDALDAQALLDFPASESGREVVCRSSVSGCGAPGSRPER